MLCYFKDWSHKKHTTAFFTEAIFERGGKAEKRRRDGSDAKETERERERLRERWVGIG